MISSFFSTTVEADDCNCASFLLTYYIAAFIIELPFNFHKRNAMEEQSREEQCLRKAEEYVKEHDIQRIVKDCIVQLCIHRPDNPYSFLRQHFASLEKVRANSVRENSTFP